MAKDVITYKLLKILYEALKHGKSITEDELNKLSSSINHEYWIYILATLSKCGYISGVELINTLTGKDIKVININITPKGIEYLEENSKMNKVNEIISKAPDWIELLAQFMH